MSCEHNAFVVSLVVATLDSPSRVENMAGSPGSGEGEERLRRKYGENDDNVDSTVRRLAASPVDGGASQQPWNAEAVALEHSPVENMLTGMKRRPFDRTETFDGGRANSDVGLDSGIEVLVGTKRSREQEHENLDAGMSISADSDAVLGPTNKAAFGNSALKRLIDSDSDDDFDDLRRL